MKTQRIARDFKMTHEYGMHARPAARLVKTACRYEAEISVGFQGVVVNAKSILGILSLGIVCGEQVAIVADGEDASEAVQAIARLFESAFEGEEEEPVRRRIANTREGGHAP